MKKKPCLPTRQDSLIIAHRGESHDAPENTLAAINLAWQKNADAVEIDIQLSKDNKIVVIHDVNTKRTGGRNKLVKRQTLEELKKLDVGIYKDKRWRNERIPTLKEILETVPVDKKLIIEIKCGPEIINILKDEINKSGLKIEQIEVISFDFSTAVKVKKALPGHNVLWLSKLDYTRLRKIFPPSIDKLIARTLENNLDGLDLWAGKMINKELVGKVRSAGLKLYVWTVNDPIKAKQLIDMDVDGITTDRAQWLVEKLFVK